MNYLDDDTLKKCAAALKKLKLSKASLPKSKEEKYLGWLTAPETSPKSARLRALLKDLENKLANGEIKSSRVKGLD